MSLPVTPTDVAAASELNPFIPHPIEIALAAHVLLVLVILVVAVVLASTRRVRMGWVGWVGFAVLLLGPFPVVGPLAAATLVGLNLRPKPGPQGFPTS